MMYRVAWMFCLALIRVLFRRRTFGAENVPQTGAVILASNHVSVLDPPVVGTGIWRPCAFMAKEELFKNPAVGWFIRRLYAFPVRRGRADRGALKHSLEVLERGMALVMFPEGTRSESGEMQEPEVGVGMIACRSGAPVVPVFVAGTEKVLPKGGGLRFAPISVTYGEPIRFVSTEGKRPGREDYDLAARRIMGAIAQLRDRHRTEGDPTSEQSR